MSIRLRPVLTAAWPTVLAVLLLLPLFTGRGHPLARDLVFVPEQPWTDAAFGLGPVPPRAVPLDSVMVVLTTVVDGGLVGRVALLLTLASAGWGVARLVRRHGTAAMLAASGLAVWNPFVIERLALGQWALLVGYAAVPWILVFATAWGRERRRRDLVALVAWCWVGSITPTGGVLVFVTLLVLAVRQRGLIPLLALGVLLQVPWLVAALAGSADNTSDPAAVTAFAPDTEGPLPAWVATMGTGGIWDSLSEPASATTWWMLVSVVVALGSVIAAAVFLWREREPDRAFEALTLLGLLALLAVLVLATAGGQRLLAHLVETVPGAGLARDGQKWLAPYVVLVACSFGVVTARVLSRLRRFGGEVTASAALVLLLVPFLMVPDATARTWPTVRPVELPEAYAEVDAALRAAAVDGDDSLVVSLPWRSYRRFDWGNGLTSSDPALRMLSRTVVVNDELVVGPRVLAGESSYVADVGSAARSGSLEDLADLGIGWMLVHPDDPDYGEIDSSGAEVVVSSPELELHRLPDPATPPQVTPVRRGFVLGAHLLWWAVGAGAILIAAAQLARRVRRDVRSGDTLQ